MNLTGKIAALFGRTQAPAAAAPDVRNALTNDGTGWGSFFGVSSPKTVAGFSLTEIDLLKLPAIRQSVQIISGDIACSTLGLHRSTVEPGEDSLQKSHPTNVVVGMKWGEFETAFEGWRRLVTHALLWGNGFAYIKRDSRGRISWMSNLPPGACQVAVTDAGDLMYTVQLEEGDEPEPVRPLNIFHLRGLSIENDEAEAPILSLRDTASVYLGAQTFEGAFFANGAQSGGIITVPPGVPDNARERLETQIQKKSASENWFRTMVLRDGAQFHSTTVDARSAEMIGIKESVVRDVARFFNLPGFKLGIEDSVSYNSAEQGQRAYLTGCLNHWLRAITSEAYVKLLPASLQASGEYRFEHNVSKLVEPDFRTLNEILAIQRQNEIISANDWRRKINLPVLADEDADTRVNPNTKANVAAPAAAEEEEEAGEPETPEKKKAALTETKLKAERRLIKSAVQRASKRICTPLLNRAKSQPRLREWLDGEDIQNREILNEELSDIAGLLFSDDAGNFIQSVSDNFFAQLLPVVEGCLCSVSADTDLHSTVAAACDTFTSSLRLNLPE